MNLDFHGMILFQALYKDMYYTSPHLYTVLVYVIFIQGRRGARKQTLLCPLAQNSQSVWTECGLLQRGIDQMNFTLILYRQIKFQGKEPFLGDSVGKGKEGF